ncbi:hypothetical protein CBS101457_006522 [Exobasidium rhododendri]|nr:hypothetical protein CBS101457_006522 [Exobasidium rhododendri]
MSSSKGKEKMSALFPITHPYPDPSVDLTLIPQEDIALEQDLLLNSLNPRSWQNYINHVLSTNRPSESQSFFHDPDAHYSSSQVKLLGPLSSSSNRLALRRLTYVYERAISSFPTSYTLWKDYILQRMKYVLGEPSGGLNTFWAKQIQAARVKLDVGPTLIASKEGGSEEWEWGTLEGGASALDGRVGYREWASLAAVFERALMYLPKMPRIWSLYFTVLMHPQCPPTLSHTHSRRTFDRALRTLPPSLHLRIWKSYLKWAEMRGGETCLRIWRRYVKVDPSLTERYVGILEKMREEDEEEEEEEEDEKDESSTKLKERRSLEAAKILLRLAKDSIDGKYVSPEGKSSYTLLLEWLELCEKHSEEVGLERGEEDGVDLERELINLDTLSPSRIPVSQVVRTLGLARFPDQAGRLWTGLATYWIRRGDLMTAKDTFEEGMAAVLTVRDFTQIFDAYAETSENVISFLMDELSEEGEDEEEDGDTSRQEKEADLDKRMKDFEELMERRPFLVNEVLLRRNPNDVQEWEKRVLLFGEDNDKVIETYKKAIETISPRKATANHHHLYINFAYFYEKGGHRSESDVESARGVLEKGTTIPFKRVDDLAEIWCEWAEMEIRNGNFEAALRIMSRASVAPKTAAAVKAINFYDESLTVQKRLFKSSKLWSFYIDLEESIGSIEGTKDVYDKIIDLKIATPQNIINFANFLEENKYFEESYKVYERGIEVFTYPVAFEIWNIYLSKFVKRYGATKLERARDLFEQALEKCPEKFCRALYLMFGKLEEEHGLAKRAIKIYERATEKVSSQDKFNMYVFYIAKVAANFGLAATRPVYERAIEVLPDKQTAEICLRFANLEKKLGEIDRARTIFAHASQFCDPRSEPQFWKEWNNFEIDHGSEDTFREMLRIKRSIQAQYNTDVSYIAAYAMSAQQRATAAQSKDIVAVDMDPMARAEQEATAKQSRIAASGFVAAKQSTASVPDPASAAPERNQEDIGGGGEDDDDLM